jgi:hypothetical protein
MQAVCTVSTSRADILLAHASAGSIAEPPSDETVSQMDIKLRDDAVLVADGDPCPEFVSLQPVSIVDHVVSMTDEPALKRIIQGDEIGGSRRVDVQEVQRILGE